MTESTDITSADVADAHDVPGTDPATPGGTVVAAGSLAAAALGRTVRFRHEAATYEGHLTAVQHRTDGIGDGGPVATMLSVRAGEWFTHRSVDATTDVTIIDDDSTTDPGKR